ncbi:FkbM family methyltransferase [Streptomyces sp. NBC_01190]|uniref:FkbM family methyltransferase n=1 Tax=Streptomyces sp. NBC_01190 TaxID=2903767 RepID=UPI003863C360|nr:FkbM family methyltransferase [Streptomyces sp. NBC_01190]
MSNPTTEALVTLGRWYVRNAPGTLGKAPLAGDFLNPHLRDNPRRRVSTTETGARFALDTQDLIQRYLYLFGTWEPRMTQWLRRRLRPGDTFVDVGANIGYFSVIASELVGPEGKVVAIEASRAFQDRLEQNARLNGCTNIRALHTAVSDKRQTLTFILASSHNMGANSIVPYDGPAESTFEIEAFPLPDVLEEDEITSARVIKVDVEGAEGSVVRGMVALLDRLRPDAEITVEVTPERMAQLGDSVEELLDTMRGAGFNVYRLANEYAAATYPSALRGESAVPVRWRGPVTGESDLIFSRVDAETLP